MFGCCAFVPLGLLMIVAPMIAAGRGMRAFRTTAMLELGIVLMVWLFSLPLIFDALENWRTDALVILPFAALFAFPLTLGAVILYAKAAEEKPRENVCRVCGYDLRASPERCPECGTPVQPDPRRF